MKRLLILAVCLVVLCSCGGEEPTQPVIVIEVTATPTTWLTATPTTWLTLDGKEADGTLAVTEINLWKDHDNRGAGIAGVGQHGQQVKLIRRVGEGVQIELPDGTRGWVTYYFIKEYK
jgi:hypothetical protein